MPSETQPLPALTTNNLVSVGEYLHGGVVGVVSNLVGGEGGGRGAVSEYLVQFAAARREEAVFSCPEASDGGCGERAEEFQAGTGPQDGLVGLRAGVGFNEAIQRLLERRR